MTHLRNEALNLLCPISDEPVDTVTPCGHLFQKKAITDWINASNKKDANGENCLRECPICKTEISVPRLVLIFGLTDISSQFKKIKKELETAEIKLQNIPNKYVESKNIFPLERRANGLMQTTSALAVLLRQQEIDVLERKKLMMETKPILKSSYKKLALLRKLIVEMDDCEVYKLNHAQLAEKLEKKIILPYVERLTQLNKRIEANESQLKTLRTDQNKETAKIALRSRVASLFVPKFLGGSGKIVNNKANAEIKTPVQDVKQQASLRVSAIEQAKMTQLLLTALKEGSEENTLIALQRGANPNFVDNYGVPMILVAAKNKNMGIIRLLVEHKANINSFDHNGYSALHSAINNKNMDLAIVLLELGADPRVKRDNGFTPLKYMEHFNIRDALLEEVLANREMELNQMEQQIFKSR